MVDVEKNHINPERLAIAKKAGDFLNSYFKTGATPPKHLIVLGTNGAEMFAGGDIGDHKDGLPLHIIPGFNEDLLGKLSGHKRRVFLKEIGGRPCWVLAGRVHVNEIPYSTELMDMVRLQTEMFLCAGVEKAVITNAAGALDPKMPVGSVNIADGFVTILQPTRPHRAGEFVDADSVLCPEMMKTARSCASDAGLDSTQGGYWVWNGPAFEGGQYDKKLIMMIAWLFNVFIATLGQAFNLFSTSKDKLGKITCIGMSTLYAASIIASHRGHSTQAEVLAISLITNGPGVHSHAHNQREAKKAMPKMERMLSLLVERIEA